MDNNINFNNCDVTIKDSNVSLFTGTVCAPEDCASSVIPVGTVVNFVNYNHIPVPIAEVNGKKYVGYPQLRVLAGLEAEFPALYSAIVNLKKAYGLYENTVEVALNVPVCGKSKARFFMPSADTITKYTESVCPYKSTIWWENERTILRDVVTTKASEYMTAVQGRVLPTSKTRTGVLGVGRVFGDNFELVEGNDPAHRWNKSKVSPTSTRCMSPAVVTTRKLSYEQMSIEQLAALRKEKVAEASEILEIMSAKWKALFE